VLSGRRTACDYTRPGKPDIAWDDKAAKAVLIDGLVLDALALLDALTSTDTDQVTAEPTKDAPSDGRAPTGRAPTGRAKPMRPVRRWHCWRCWPVRTSNGSTTVLVVGGGGSRSGSPGTGSSPPWTPKPGAGAVATEFLPPARRAGPAAIGTALWVGATNALAEEVFWRAPPVTVPDNPIRGWLWPAAGFTA